MTTQAWIYSNRNQECERATVCYLKAFTVTFMNTF